MRTQYSLYCQRLKSVEITCGLRYTQMFGADWIPDHADTVRGVFQTILDKIQTQNAPGRNNQPLVLSCRTHFASADSTDEW